MDLEYPEELHVLHIDYPLAPEKISILYDTIIVILLLKIADECGIKFGAVMKLIPNLGDKTSYVLHYRRLQFYLPLGKKLNKIQAV